MWGIDVDEDDTIWFYVLYQALGAGLDPEALKYICESLVAEAAEFDDRMRKSGLLR